MTNEALDPALSLSLRLLEQKSYHALTYELLEILKGFEEVEYASSYEVFTLSRHIDTPKDYSVRRFPMSLDDCQSGEHNLLLDAVVIQHQGGI